MEAQVDGAVLDSTAVSESPAETPETNPHTGLQSLPKQSLPKLLGIVGGY